ncbi:acyl-CoA dehydrogenase family protein [Sphingobacterium chungjuense]|uniref:acyl-CoA dehydrogenase family protein n=1 Tax=Sphingobacterium chungjuense TaxID=2675553 RepID=UPI00140E6883|nr:acyl-CoA dehydrogenase family protein [Sphingobacterium chungjuense]
MLSQDIINLIQEHQSFGTKAGVLPDVILQKIRENSWFDLWVPKEYGGLEQSLVDGCRLLESLAYWDGSLGWTVTLCAGANMFVGFIDSATANALFRTGNVCFGGSGRASGKAIKVAGGYRLTGRWSYATGAPHLTHFTCNAMVIDAEMKSSEKPEVTKSFFVPREHVLIEPDWHTFGLEATASHSFTIEDVFVPIENSFELHPDAAIHAAKLFQYPFQPFAECTLFVNYLGMYSRYTDIVQKNFYIRAQNGEWQEKHGKTFFRELDVAQQLAENTRKNLYDLMSESWSNLLHNKEDDNIVIYEKIGILTRESLRMMRSHVLDMHVKCGIEAAQSDSELNMLFRNFFTATQHALLQS